MKHNEYDEHKSRTCMPQRKISTRRYKRDWAAYNEALVRRGELYIALDFLDHWDDEIVRMNRHKRGRPYILTQFIRFLAYLHVLFLPYRQLEGFVRALSKHIPELKAPDTPRYTDA